ncbi:MAG: transposase [Nitrospira sp.]|nr:transposase [Nitrospira sp.]
MGHDLDQLFAGIAVQNPLEGIHKIEQGDVLQKRLIRLDRFCRGLFPAENLAPHLFLPVEPGRGFLVGFVFQQPPDKFLTRKLRWPDGFRCPDCGNPKTWLTSNKLFRCRACESAVSVTAGTIFQDTRKSLKLWFTRCGGSSSKRTGRVPLVRTTCWALAARRGRGSGCTFCGDGESSSSSAIESPAPHSP